MTAADYRHVVAALRAVPGVAEARVEPDAQGGVGVLRLGLDVDADEVEVATAVGRLLRERFGLGVDADRVQLVEGGSLPSQPGPATAARGRRAAITHVQIAAAGLDVTAHVTLGFGERSATGHSTGTATQSGVRRTVSVATLQAAEELVGGRARFEVEQVEVTTTGAERTVVVTVVMVSTTGGSERLSGSAVVRDDVRQACVRATLAAVNRRLEPLLA